MSAIETRQVTAAASGAVAPSTWKTGSTLSPSMGRRYRTLCKAAVKRLYVKWSADAWRRSDDMNKPSFLAAGASAFWHQVSGLTHGVTHG